MLYLFEMRAQFPNAIKLILLQNQLAFIKQKPGSRLSKYNLLEKQLTMNPLT